MSQSSRLNKYFTLLIYVSLIFLLVFLYRSDVLSIDLQRFNGHFFAASIVFLFMGFAANAVCWSYYCKPLHADVSMVDAFISHGLSVFGKYIPGKIWVILGRAAYFSSSEIPLAAASQLSLYTQIVAIWSGLTLGVAGIAALDPPAPLLWLLLPVWFMSGVGLFVPLLVTGQRTGSLGRLMDRVNVLHTFITPGYVLRTIPLFFVLWCSWAVGFYLLGCAVGHVGALPWQVMFAFPFAATIGIAAIVFPGGIGVREGLIVYYMVLAGIPAGEATLVSIVARLWFLVGEIFSFTVALMLRMRSERNR